MSDYSELVERLRDIHNTISRFKLALHPKDPLFPLGLEMVDALEAMAGEVEKWKQEAAWDKAAACDFLGRAEEAESERDRLKAALRAFVKHFGPLQDNAMLHEDVRNCYRLARAALEEK